jgi:hypothetical protein
VNAPSHELVDEELHRTARHQHAAFGLEQRVGKIAGLELREARSKLIAIELLNREAGVPQRVRCRCHIGVIG